MAQMTPDIAAKIAEIGRVIDPPAIEQDSIGLIGALCKAGRCPRTVFLKTHNHMSGGASIGSKDTELSDQILAFVTTGK